MTIEYRYIGIYIDGRPLDRPVGVVRVWTDANGEQQEETFGESLTWEPSEVFSPMARPTYDDHFEIDESVVDKYIARVRARYGDE